MYSTQGLTKTPTTWANITAGDILDGELVIAVEHHEEGHVAVEFSDLTWSPWRPADNHVSVFR